MTSGRIFIAGAVSIGVGLGASSILADDAGEEVLAPYSVLLVGAFVAATLCRASRS
jgi:hypothetical protein